MDWKRTKHVPKVVTNLAKEKREVISRLHCRGPEYEQRSKSVDRKADPISYDI